MTNGEWKAMTVAERLAWSKKNPGCNGHDWHEYSSKICPKCGAVFCYSCCASTNVDQGGKYDPDYMLCPVCGHDYYS